MEDIPRKIDIDIQKTLIGDFFVKFEGINALIRLMILQIIYPRHDSKQYNNIEALLEGLTADQLRKKLEALIINNFGENEAIWKLTSALSNKFLNLITIRNSFAHGSFMLGWKDQNGALEKDSLIIKHPKISSKGIESNFKPRKVDDLKDLIKKANAIDDAYSVLCVLLQQHYLNENLSSYLVELEESINSIGTVKF